MKKINLSESSKKKVSDLLKEVINSIAGKQAEEIVELLNTKKYVNEFLIAKKLNITINQTRNILYKIADSGLVSSTRKKDKKKGWYTYFWKIEVLKSLEFLKEQKLKKLDSLFHHIKSRELHRFYICERCNIELREENALMHNFTCQECGVVFKLKDNKKLLRELDKNKNRLEKELSYIEEEINSETGKIDREKEKERKKKSIVLEKEKERKKKINALAREKERKNKQITKNSPNKISSLKKKSKTKSIKKLFDQNINKKTAKFKKIKEFAKKRK